MRRSLWIGVVAAITLTAAPAAAQQAGRTGELSAAARQELADRIAARDGRAIIGFKAPALPRGMTPAGERLLSRASARATAADLRGRGLNVTREFDLIPAVAARIDPGDLPGLLSNPRIDYVEPDHLYEPTDMSVPTSGPIPRVGQSIPWGIARIGAPDAWSTSRGAGVKIGIIDTGIDEDHPDLTVLGGINLVTGGTTRADWNDESAVCIPHGTHVAGSAAALDNSIGVVGVAPDAGLYALRVFDPEADGIGRCLASNSHIIAGYEWAVANALDVVNLSLGSPFPSFAASDATAATHAAGVTVIASSGNSYSSNPGSLVACPAAYPHAIAVAASTEADAIARFTKKGLEVEIAAPGDGVESTWGDGGYAFANGTSMAAPHVTAVAAAIIAANGSLGPDEVRSVIASTAEDLGAGLTAQGAGLVRADSAVATVGSGVAALATTPPSMLLTSPAGGAAQMATIALRNVGTAGSVSWTAAPDQPWLSVTASGSATDQTPSTLTVTADPAGLAAYVHQGSITISATATNSPLIVPVRLAVTGHIVLDPDSVVTAQYPAGSRARVTLDGTAGQRIDIVARPGARHMARLIMPDGRTPLAIDDRAHTVDAYAWGESYILGATLPETGRYFVEVGHADDTRGLTFDLRARPADGVLGVAYDRYSAASRLLYLRPIRVEEGGADGVAVDTLYNVSAFGSVDFEVTTPPEITPSASSGAFSSSLPIELRVSSAGLVAGANPEPFTVEYADPDEWLLQGNTFTTWERDFDVHVYSPGMVTAVEDRVSDFGGAAMIASGDAIVAVDGFGIQVVRADGSLGAAIPTSEPICSGLAASMDLLWFATACYPPEVVEVSEDGTVTTVATLPSPAQHVAAGPDFLYVSVCAEDQVYRVDRASGIAEPFGPAVECPEGLHFSSRRNTLYVAVGGGAGQGVQAVAANGSDLGAVATEISQAHAISEGDSGLLYIGDHRSGLWTFDPETAGPATPLAWWPGPYASLTGLTVLDRALVSSASIPLKPTFNSRVNAQSDIYAYPIADRPVRTLFARLAGPPRLATIGDTLPIHIKANPILATEAVSSFSAEVGWSPTDAGFGGLAAGSFSAGGTFEADSSMARSGTISAGGTASPAVADTTTLLSLGLEILPGTPLDQPIPLSLTFTELDGPTVDLLPELRQPQVALCVSYPFGDPTRDRIIGSGDAVQILRELVQLPLAAGVDIELGDADGNGAVGVSDVIAILRHAVALPTPATNLGLSNAGVCS